VKRRSASAATPMLRYVAASSMALNKMTPEEREKYHLREQEHDGPGSE
jgi:hypothetical protein